jgi:phosphatidylinositol-3-phosphatase
MYRTGRLAVVTMTGLAGLFGLVLLGLVKAADASTKATAGTGGVPGLSHIVVVFLENESATGTFEDASAAPALAALVKEGSYVHDYWAAGHASLDNYLALFSGQQPDASTEADCLGMAPASCMYLASVPTLATTLGRAGLSWKAYSEGMEGAPGGHNCLHSPTLSTPDPYQGPERTATAPGTTRCRGSPRSSTRGPTSPTARLTP